jgi:hypothetical protein
MEGTAVITSLKPKECQGCGSMFSPRSSFARACCQRCATKVVNADKKAERVQTKARKEALITYSQRKAKAQKAVNEYVRIRDAGKPCISCRTPWEPTFQAGHYRSRGAAPQLALDRRNIASQCIQCNLHLHGNPIGFRAGLIERHGEDHVRAIESENEPLKLTHEELQQITIINKADAKALKDQS